jgi:hypothetical protein
MSEPTPTQEALSDSLDEALLDIIKNGQIVLDADGNAILDAARQPVRMRPSAAYFQAAITRLRALGITSLVTPDSKAGQLAKECGFEDDPNILHLPTIDLEPNERTGS